MERIVRENKSLISVSVNHFGVIPEEELEYLMENLFPVKIHKQEFFLSRGEISSRFALNISGLMRLYYIDKNANEVNKFFCDEKKCAISFSSFIYRKPSKFYIEAMEDTSLLCLDHSSYLKLLDRHPCWQKAIGKFSEFLFSEKEQRESDLLLLDAEERYRKFLERNQQLEKRLPQYHIASFLGITPESLSRVRAKMKKG